MPFLTVLPSPQSYMTDNNPPGWTQHWGGVNFPTTQDITEANVPAIGFATDDTRPDETVSVVGENLTNSEFAVWTEGGTFTVLPIRSASQRAQLSLLKYFAVSNEKNPLLMAQRLNRHSVTLIWPKNANGYGRPIRINHPQIFWVSPGKKWRWNGNRKIRIFGRNLGIKGRQSKVVFNRNNGTVAQARILFQSVNELIIELPYDYQDGDYKLWVHNGTGKNLGWSNYGTFTAIAINYNTTTVFEIDKMAGTTDQQKFDNAMAAIRTNGGGIVNFEAREYTITTNQNNIPGNASPEVPVILQGKGRDLTTITSGVVATQAGQDRVFNIIGPGSRIYDIGFKGIEIKVRTTDVVIERIKSECYSANITSFYDYAYGTYIANAIRPPVNANLDINDNIFYSNLLCIGLNIGHLEHVRISKNKFYGRYKNGYYSPTLQDNTSNNGIDQRGCHKLLVEDNEFYSESVLAGNILSRAYCAWYGHDSHVVIQRNKTRNVGSFNSTGYRGTNIGELILFHGENFGVGAVVTSSTNTGVNVSSSIGTIDDTGNRYLTYSNNNAFTYKFVKMTIVSGRAAGQVRVINSLTANGGETTINVDYVHLTPQAGDRVVLSATYFENLILNNDLNPYSTDPVVSSDFMRAGILIYTAMANSVISGNTIRNCTIGIGCFHYGSSRMMAVGNSIRSNAVYNCIKYPGDGSNSLQEAIGYIDWDAAVGTPTPNNDQFHAIGNAWRSNLVDGSQMGYTCGMLNYGNLRYQQDPALWTAPANSGVLMSVFENGVITNISGVTGFPNLDLVAGIYADWTLYRNNLLDSNVTGQPDTEYPTKVFEPLVDPL